MNIVNLDKLSEMFWDGNFIEIHKDDIPSIPSAFEGMTNGEVIQTLFPNANYDSGRLYMHIINVNTIGEIVIPWRWWNAPYQKGGEE